MDPRELQLAQRLLSRANPPPILYRYRKPHEWTLAEVREHQIHLTAPKDLNDPFEYLAPVFWNADSLRKSFIERYAPTAGIPQADAEKEFNACFKPEVIDGLQAALEQIRDDSGVICLSAIPDSTRMWSYYAQSHEGVCLGFDSSRHPFFAALKVKYQSPDEPLDVAAILDEDPTKLAEHISLRKAQEWEFEQEYRLIVGQIGNKPRLVPFDPFSLTEVRLGARLKDDFKAKLFEALNELPHRPRLIQMKCDFERFILREEVL